MPIKNLDKTGKSEESLTEIESFFGINEEVIKNDSSTTLALVIGMVVHRGLSNEKVT